LIERRWTNTAGESIKLHLGTPRSWISNATGQTASLYIVQDKDLAPMQLNVGGQWNRAKLGSNYPCTDIPYNAIYKLTSTTISACWQVPHDMISTVQIQIEHSDPEAVWYEPAAVAVPAFSFAAALPNGPEGRFDHAVLYRFFEQEFTPRQIATATNTLVNTVNYVYRKWKSGHSPVYSHKATRILNQAEMLSDMQNGLTSIEISAKYDCTVVTVNKMAKKHNLILNRPNRDKSSATMPE